MSEKRYPVQLSTEQRQELSHLIHTGKSTAHQQMAARVLLKADEALEISPRTVIRTKQRFVQQGLSVALTGTYPKERPLRRQVDGSSTLDHAGAGRSGGRRRLGRSQQ